MDFGEIIRVVVGAVLAGAPPVFVFVCLPAYWGWMLGRHLRGQ